jgi:agmatinase
MLDAHADCFDTYAGDRNSHACVVRRIWDTVGVAASSTCLVGLRSFARAELESIDQAGLVITAVDWSEAGSEETARQIAEVVGARPLYVSLDIDVLDPAAAPGTGYPVAGGPDCRAVLDLLSSLWNRARVVGVDLVEVAPALDPSDSTPAVAAHVLLQVLAHFASRGTHRSE